MVTTLVAGILGEPVVADLGFTDLGGSGMASRLTTMVTGFTAYAERTVVIVDREGNMATYIKGLIRNGKLQADDVLLFDRSLEESNFTPAQLGDALVRYAANPPTGRPPVSLTLTSADLTAEHHRQTKAAKRGERPGLAGALLQLAEDPAYGGPVRVAKPDFATVLAEYILGELDAANGDAAAEDAVIAKRPLLRFIVERMFPVLTNPRWR